MYLKLIFLLVSIVGIVLTAPVDDHNADTVKYEFIPNSGDGYYKFSYETSNGLEREEEGTPALGKDNTPILRVKGFYSYYSGNDKVKVNYEADEDGYRESPAPLLVALPPQVAAPPGLIASLVGGGLG